MRRIYGFDNSTCLRLRVGRIATLLTAATIAPLLSFGGGDGWLAPGEGGYTFLGTGNNERGSRVRQRPCVFGEPNRRHQCADSQPDDRCRPRWPECHRSLRRNVYAQRRGRRWRRGDLRREPHNSVHNDPIHGLQVGDRRLQPRPSPTPATAVSRLRGSETISPSPAAAAEPESPPATTARLP